MITRQFGIPVTSPGAILRREKDLGTALGIETAEAAQRGDLVPDKIIVGLIEDWLRLHGGQGFVFDGFPRTTPQAESLQAILTRLRTQLDLAIWLEVSEQTVADRIAHRLQCQACGFTTSETSAVFAERPICPYCDGPLIRRTDDDAGGPAPSLGGIQRQNAAAGGLLRGASERCTGLMAIGDRDEVFADISHLIEQAS